MRLKTHCPNGHEYTEQNTAVARGYRRCRVCHNRRLARQAMKQKPDDWMSWYARLSPERREARLEKNRATRRNMTRQQKDDRNASMRYNYSLLTPAEKTAMYQRQRELREAK